MRADSGTIARTAASSSTRAAAQCARAARIKSRTRTRCASAISRSASGLRAPARRILAVAAAVEALASDAVRRIVLVRPAVEAGERLGFLPGDLTQKIDPYLRPDVRRALRDDGLRQGRPAHRAPRHRDRAARVHARPHAERVVRDSRRGAEHDARADEDVPDAHRLRLARRRDGRHHADRLAARQGVGAEAGRRAFCASVPGIAFIHFTAEDVVRHPLVQRIVSAYAREEESKEE